MAAEEDPYAEFDADFDPYAMLDEQPAEEEEKTPFPEKRGTSRASIQLPEVAQLGTRKFLPPAEGVRGAAKNAGVTAAILTTSDPAEIAKMLAAQNPDVGITYAPDGALIATNNANGAQAVINRPGASYMDILQTLGLASAFTPIGGLAAGATAVPLMAARTAITETAKKKALNEATKAAVGTMTVGSGVTEGALQAGQSLAGGEFNAGDVALSAAAGAIPEYIAKPVVGATTKLLPGSLQEAKNVLPTSLGGKSTQEAAKEIAPATITQALQYAEDTGKKIATSDALFEKLTPPLKIFFKMAERIPLTGLGSTRVKQQAQRADTLTELAHEYNIDVDTDLGQEIAQSFVDRMVRARFWGANKNPTTDQLGRAWKRESDMITDRVLRKHVANGDLNGDIVDKLLDSDRPVLMRELFGKLTPDGRRAVRQRFMSKALEAGKWRPDAAPQSVDPTKFAAFMDTPEARRSIRILFSERDQEVLAGAREYLKITQKAQTAGKGLGMAASAGVAGVSLMAEMLNALVGTLAVTSAVAHTVESDVMRNQFLRLAHAKGNPEATEAIMNAIRPAIVAGAEQWRQQRYDLPQVDIPEITPDMLKTESQKKMSELKRRAKESTSGLAELPSRIIQMLQGAAP
jgi:hypothetical protein